MIVKPISHLAKVITSMSLVIFLACGLSKTKTDITRQAQYKLQKISNLPINEKPTEIQFIDLYNGWISAGDNLWKTTDGGKTWFFAKVGLNNKRIEGFQFLSTEKGWVLGSDGLYKTRDGGQTWEYSSVPELSFPKGELRTIALLKEDGAGWAAGGEYHPITDKRMLTSLPNNVISGDSKSVLYGSIFRTDDGGQTWVRQSIPLRIGRVLGISFWENNSSIIFGDNGVFYSDDNGKTWKPSSLEGKCEKGYASYPYKEAIPISSTTVSPGLALLSFNNGVVAKSTDWGKSWCANLDPVDLWKPVSYESCFPKIEFLNQNQVWAISGEGMIYMSNDGGKHWDQIDIKTRLDNAYFLDTKSGWAIAKGEIFTLNK